MPLAARNLFLTLLSYAVCLWNSASAVEPTLPIELGGGQRLELAFIPKGEFQQGSPDDEAGRGSDESFRRVRISRDFYLGRYPVTRGHFARFVSATAYRTEAEVGTSGGFGFDGTKLVQDKRYTWRNPGFAQTDEHPVTIVTYRDAQAFCHWLGGIARREFDLPSEAQWEYACRAGTATAYYSGAGDAAAMQIAWFKANAAGGTRPVGQKLANAWGLYDMCGNIYEWCRDWYGPYDPGQTVDPVETRIDRSDKPRRVLRGGSWLREARFCRSAARYRNDQASRNADNGFRVMTLAVERPPLNVEVESSQPTAPVARPPVVAAPSTTEPSRQPDQQRLPENGPLRRGGGLFGIGGAACFGLFCLAVVGAIVAAVVFTIIKGRRGGEPFAVPSGTTPRARPPLVPRIASDGFWLDSPDIEPGSVIHYRYRAGGEQISDQHVAVSSLHGQFIYTGQQPSDVEVLEIVPSGQEPRGTWRGGTLRPTSIVPEPPIPPPPLADEPPRRRGFPPAY